MTIPPIASFIRRALTTLDHKKITTDQHTKNKRGKISPYFARYSSALIELYTAVKAAADILRITVSAWKPALLTLLQALGIDRETASSLVSQLADLIDWLAQ